MSKIICSVYDCKNNRKSKLYCEKHWDRFKKYGTTELPIKQIKICSVENCQRTHYALGYCDLHYERFKEHGDPVYKKPTRHCSVENCHNKYKGNGLCHNHNTLMKRNGTIEIDLNRASKTMKEGYRTGRIKIPHGKREYYKNICFRSTWEVQTAKWLDQHNIEWLYESKVFSLKINNSYTPDFYLPKLDKYIEVKGYWREDAKNKFNEFKTIYSNKSIYVMDNIKKLDTTMNEIINEVIIC